MAILIDPPRWPAHDTLWAHLVSDASLAELHDFARRAGIPHRGFDHDHYDVPAGRHAALVALGAEPVASTELVRRLVASGLRVRTPDRTPTRAAALAEAGRRWDALFVVTERGRTWDVRQVIDDPAGHHDWAITATVDLDASDEAGELVLTTGAFARLDGPTA